MAGQKSTRRQKDISRLVREKKAVGPVPFKKDRHAPVERKRKRKHEP